LEIQEAAKQHWRMPLWAKIFYSGTIIYHLAESLSHANKVLLIEQQHRFKNLSNTSEFYYQQRFNSSDADNSITVEQALKEYSKDDTPVTTLEKWIELLHLAPLLQEPLIQLSNGENKRLQLAEALLSDPAVLIMDNPFIGLDAEGRKTLHRIIDMITKNGIHVILITTPQELPESITDVAVLENGTLTHFTKEKYYSSLSINGKKEESDLNRIQLNKINNPGDINFSFAIRMINTSIQYGDKKILDNINWEVKQGDCWNISGPNGAGKSTLLSLVTSG